MSTVMQLLLPSNFTFVAFGLILLASAANSTLEDDKQGENLVLLRHHESGVHVEAMDEETSGTMKEVMQLQPFTTTRIEGSNHRLPLNDESITVSRKLVLSIRHTPPYNSVDQSVPQAPVLLASGAPKQNIDDQHPLWRRVQVETKKFFAAQRSSNADFHTDYGGPWTHPPRNN